MQCTLEPALMKVNAEGHPPNQKGEKTGLFEPFCLVYIQPLSDAIPCFVYTCASFLTVSGSLRDICLLEANKETCGHNIWTVC